MNAYIDSFIAALVLILLGIIFFQHEHNKILTLEVATYQVQINQLHTDALIKEKSYKAAADAADLQIQELDKATDEIMKAKVPSDCEEATRWAISEAKTL